MDADQGYPLAPYQDEIRVPSFTNPPGQIGLGYALLPLPQLARTDGCTVQMVGLLRSHRRTVCKYFTLTTHQVVSLRRMEVVMP